MSGFSCCPRDTLDSKDCENWRLEQKRSSYQLMMSGLNMSATADEFLLPTRRPPYIRAPSTGGDDFDTRSEASDMPLTRPTSSIPASRIHPEQVSRRKLFLKLLLFWIGTILWTAALIGLVSGYTAKGVLTSAQKSTFNFLLTVVILILGLTFFVS